jgi:hypothetical protein
VNIPNLSEFVKVLTARHVHIDPELWFTLPCCAIHVEKMMKTKHFRATPASVPTVMTVAKPVPPPGRGFAMSVVTMNAPCTLQN